MTDITQPSALPRYKIGYHSDEWGQRSSTPSGIPDPQGPWVRFEDAQKLIARVQQHEAELAAIGAVGVSGPLLGGAALAAQAPQPGYVLVPVEPTPKMLNDAVKALNEAAASLVPYSAPDAAYRAMIAAAPKAPQHAAPAVGDDLRDRLVAISAAIADQDDRGAQAMLREILAAPQQEVQEPDDITVWKARALQAEAAIEKFMTQPAPSGDAEDAARYRLLNLGVDVIQADDEFLSDDTTTWDTDPNGVFVGMPYAGYALLPARRKVGAIDAARKEGK